MLRKFASFNLEENLFGIDVLLIKEINRNLEITPVDRAPELVVGLMNLRGQIVTVVDLGIRLGLGKREITPKTRCIVLKTTSELEHKKTEGIVVDNTSNDLIGLLVDGIGDMVTVEEEVIEPPPSNVSGVHAKYLEGVVKLEKNLLVTLRISEILSNGSTVVKL